MPRISLLFALTLMSKGIVYSATTHYVDTNSANAVSPYVTWATAANVIQDAVDIADPGDVVLVTNGIYNTGGRIAYGVLTNRVALTQPIILESVNGPHVTIIEGNPALGDSAIRCVYLTNGCTLVGFTLRDGATAITTTTFSRELEGGGILCESESAVVSNCVLTANAAANFGGAVSSGTLYGCQILGNTSYWGGGTYAAVLNNCLVSSNTAWYGGGGCFGSILTNCLVSSNSCVGFDPSSGGGGINGTYAVGCLISNNFAFNIGGGAAQSGLEGCVVISNTAFFYGGGADSCTVNSSLIYRNGSGVSHGTLNNSTVVQNRGAGAYNVQFAYNSVIYYNSGADVTFPPSDPGYFYDCCTPTSFSPGNFTNPPSFVNAGAGNFHLSSNSPCINAGFNPYVVDSVDLDGHPRISAGTVDVGAYEVDSPLSRISYLWLQQHGLFINESTDAADPDGDGVNNYQEWISRTDPTNSLSVLKMLIPVRTNHPAGLLVQWPGAGQNFYFLERSSNLATSNPFSIIASNFVASVDGIITYVDTTATNTIPYFYRVRVRQ